MPKYHNRKVTLDGHTFDSQAEARRYKELLLLQKAGKARNLRVHPRWKLYVNGKLICSYTADFVYIDIEQDGVIVEDVKGVRTPVYRLKKKLLKALYGIDIQEIQA